MATFLKKQMLLNEDKVVKVWWHLLIPRKLDGGERAFGENSALLSLTLCVALSFCEKFSLQCTQQQP